MFRLVIFNFTRHNKTRHDRGPGEFVSGTKQLATPKQARHFCDLNFLNAAISFFDWPFRCCPPLSQAAVPGREPLWKRHAKNPLMEVNSRRAKEKPSGQVRLATCVRLEKTTPSDHKQARTSKEGNRVPGPYRRGCNARNGEVRIESDCEAICILVSPSRFETSRTGIFHQHQQNTNRAPSARCEMDVCCFRFH